jgi:hypothetical protein
MFFAFSFLSILISCLAENAARLFVESLGNKQLLPPSANLAKKYPVTTPNGARRARIVGQVEGVGSGLGFNRPIRSMIGGNCIQYASGYTP